MNPGRDVLGAQRRAAHGWPVREWEHYIATSRFVTIAPPEKTDYRAPRLNHGHSLMDLMSIRSWCVDGVGGRYVTVGIDGRSNQHYAACFSGDIRLVEWRR